MMRLGRVSTLILVPAEAERATRRVYSYLTARGSIGNVYTDCRPMEKIAVDRWAQSDLI
jgi:hypothetical protein